MKGINIVVCVKIVPKPEEVKLNLETNTLDRANASSIINPPDKNAIETAIQLKQIYGGQITVISMGPPFFDGFMKLIISMGVDKAILLSDRAFAGADTYPTTKTLSQAIKKLGNVDLVICGEESADGGTGNVPPGIAEWLNYSQATYCHEIDYDASEQRFIVKRSISDGFEIISIPKPAVVSVELNINTPRFPDFSLKKELDNNKHKIPIWSATDLDLEPNEIGLSGSFTTVDSLIQAKGLERKQIQIIGNIDDIVDQLVDLIINK
ncbi:MAG: electron transfer flavoprotein subunit beta/FixA family protein [Candidatus Heimdallarchaeota archaeon]|nr:electron transfer flavoprotein subunit beta/FixA family protein [Candidatus Heimdallarchaeota archaeon]MDH5647674.1 electron transfer flavoprotein subunit beta/FixA family protein [Candidatus Heimdallarchaeota archaeon]